MRSKAFSASRYLQTSAQLLAQARGSRDAYFAAANPEGPPPTIQTFLTENFPIIASDTLRLSIHSANIWYGYRYICSLLLTMLSLITSWTHGVSID
jgi:hypothetical protein